MALQAVTPRRLGQRAPRDSTGQRGQSPPAASGSRAGHPPGPRPRLRGPLALNFVVLGVLLSVSPRRGSWLGGSIVWWPAEAGEGAGRGEWAGGHGWVPARVTRAGPTVGRIGGRNRVTARQDRPEPRGRRARAPLPGPWPGLPSERSQQCIPGNGGGSVKLESPWQAAWSDREIGCLFTILHLCLNSKTYSWQID